MAWQEPKTDWAVNPKNPVAEDFNRIEGNVGFLKGDIETKKGAIVDALNTVGLASELTDTHATMASRITGANQGTKIITPSTINQTIAKGFHSGHGYVRGDANLIGANIRSGKSIFGVTGTLEPFIQTTIASRTRGSFGYSLVDGCKNYSGENVSGPYYNSPYPGCFQIGSQQLQGAPFDFAVVTDVPVDSTNIKGILLYLNNYGNNVVSLIASTSKLGSAGIYDARVQSTLGSYTGVILLDIESLIGNFYIRVHSSSGSSSKHEVICYELLLIV